MMDRDVAILGSAVFFVSAAVWLLGERKALAAYWGVLTLLCMGLWLWRLYGP